MDLVFEVFRRFFLFLAGFPGFENSRNQMDGFLMKGTGALKLWSDDRQPQGGGSFVDHIIF